MSRRRKLLAAILSLILIIVLIAIGRVAYDFTSVMSRVVLVMTFLVITVALMWNTTHLMYGMKWNVFLILLLASLFFSLLRSSFVSPQYIVRRLNSETYLVAQQYNKEGSLTFGSPHSYFFLSPLIMTIMINVCGISLSESIYVWFSVYVFLVALISFLMLKTTMEHLRTNVKNSKTTFILPSLVALSVISFSYSERQQLPLLLAMLAMYFLIKKGLSAKSRGYPIVLLLLVSGITIGTTTGILWLIPFFFFFSILSDRRGVILYALIPLVYLLYSAYSYTLSLVGYTSFALTGFFDFFQQLIAGQPSQRVLPWGRASDMSIADVYVSSAAYLSLILLSLGIVAFSTYILARKRETKRQGESPLIWSNLSCLLLFLGIALVGYIGASFRPETTISDIRTIAMVLLSLGVPFSFLSSRFVLSISARKVFLGVIVALLLIASLRTAYEVYPKSSHDPINIVEDERLGYEVIFKVGDFITNYYKTGEVVGDYAVLKRIQYIVFASRLLDFQYQFNWLKAPTSGKPLELGYQSILVFSIAGITYPSLYHSLNDYIAAYNYSLANNIVYNNGWAYAVTRSGTP